MYLQEKSVLCMFSQWPAGPGSTFALPGGERRLNVYRPLKLGSHGKYVKKREMP